MKKIVSLFIFFSVTLLLFSCSTTGTTNANTIKDLNELNRLITSSRESQDRLFSSAFRRGGLETDDAADAPGEDSNGEGSHSKTNVQVEGVDESDTVKTDGNRIYTITYNTLNIVSISENGTMEHILKKQTTGLDASYYTGLYLTDDYLIVLAQSYSYKTDDGDYYDEDGKDDAVGESRPYEGRLIYTPRTRIEVYALDDLDLVKTFAVDGHLTTSRLIGHDLYLVSNYYTYANTLTDPRPAFEVDDTTFLPDFNRIYYLDAMPYEGFTIITHIELDEALSLDYTLYLGSGGWGEIYMNETALYFATTLYRMGRFTSGSYEGLIIRFDIDKGATFHSHASFKGFTLNQFSMDEYEGTFRLATTEGWGDDVVNRLYVFRVETNSLRQIALIDEGLGKPRETIRSVRFNQDRATVVTYELTDPFYIIDLTDPTQPFIAGELEITGFSTYQHPWRENMILGLGYEADGVMTTGIKLALYDTSDDTYPIEHGSPLVLDNETNGWQFSEALHNHKALLIEPQRDYFGFSIGSYQYTENRFMYTHDYFIFTVDLAREVPIELTARLSHGDLAPSQTDYYYYYYYSGIDRAVRINEHLYAISSFGVTRHDIEAFNTLESLRFND